MVLIYYWENFFGLLPSLRIFLGVDFKTQSVYSYKSNSQAWHKSSKKHTSSRTQDVYGNLIFCQTIINDF